MTVTETSPGTALTNPPDQTTDRMTMLEMKIDLLTERMTILTDDAARRTRERQMFTELGADLSRISGDAMDVATRELESLTATADLSDTVRLLRRLIEVAPTLDRVLVALDQAGEFVADAAPLGTDVMTLLTERLAEAERRGYFDVARAGARIADRVVTHLDEDDLDQLGDSVVTILDTVREITQPELLTLLGRMVGAVKAEQQLAETEAGKAPGFLALARQLRDPDVRRGMARALHTLRAVSIETGPRNPSTPESPTGEHS